MMNLRSLIKNTNLNGFGILVVYFVGIRSRKQKKIGTTKTKPKNGSRKMQMRRSILLPFATVQRMHSLAVEDVDGELEKHEDEQSHNPI